MVNSETSEVQRSAQGVCGGVVLWGTNGVGVKIEVRGGPSVTQLDDGTPEGEKVRCGAEAGRQPEDRNCLASRAGSTPPISGVVMQKDGVNRRQLRASDA